jgi:hypothetical protein
MTSFWVYKLTIALSAAVPATSELLEISTPFLYQNTPDDCATTVNMSFAAYVCPDDAGPVLL